MEFTVVEAHESNYVCGRESQVAELTLHHSASKSSATSIAQMFLIPNYGASANFCIGVDGDIVLSVLECNTAFANSNWASNTRSISIECSDDDTNNWTISDKTLFSLCKLLKYLCIKYNIVLKEKETLTYHRMYAATICPGDYMISLIPKIIQMTNALIQNPDIDEYAVDAVLWAVKNDILHGDEQGRYLLKDNISKEDTIVLLYRASQANSKKVSD